MPGEAEPAMAGDIGNIFLTKPVPKPTGPDGKQGRGGTRSSNMFGMVMLILTPCCLFLIIQIAFFTWYCRHYMLVYGIVLGCFMISFAFVIINSSRKQPGSWYLFLGFLSLFACISGTFAGMYNHHNHMFYYCSYDTKREYLNVLPSEPADGHVDAGKMVFSIDARVDVTRSVGFKSGSWYCVAPILDETTGTRVEYWAAGTNCCTARADFSCDASLDWRAKSGCVILKSSDILDDWIDTEFEMYKKAIKEAQATYGFVSSDDALLMRWVDHPIEFMESYYTAAVSFVFGSTMAYFLFSVVVGALLQVFSKKR